MKWTTGWTGGLLAFSVVVVSGSVRAESNDVAQTAKLDFFEKKVRPI
jgi:hypothetical protein